MNISTKLKKRILYSIPIFIGVYFIFKQFSKNKSISASLPPLKIKNSNTPSAPTQPNGNDALPLKIGSKDPGAPLNPSGRVVDIQRLINYIGYVPTGENNYVKLTEDGIFGKKTEAALNFWIQQNTIDTPLDYDYLYNMIHPTVPTVDNSNASSDTSDTNSNF